MNATRGHIFLLGRTPAQFLLAILYFIPVYFLYVFFSVQARRQEVIERRIGLIVAGLLLIAAWTYLVIWLVIEIPQHSSIRIR